MKEPATPKPRALLTAALIVVGSSIAGPSAPQRELTGTITVWRPGDSVTLARDPRPITLTLRGTVYDAVPTIQPGARVRISYRSVGERRFVADRVRVIADTAR